MRERSQTRFVSVIGYCISISVLQFVAIPLFMIGIDPGDYRFIDFKTLLLAGAVLSLCSTLLLLALYGLLASRGKSEISIILLNFLFWWVLLAGFLFPVSVSAGMVDPETVAVDVWHLSLTALIAAGLTWSGRTAVRRYLFVFASVFCLVTISTSILSIAQSDAWDLSASEAEGMHESMRLSKDQNVLVISFDGLQGHIVAELIRDNSSIAEAFKDFTVFENAMSQSPATAASIVGELFGIRDYKAFGNSLDEVKAELTNRGLTELVPLHRVDDAYQRGYEFGKAMRIRQNSLVNPADSVEFLRFALARVATRHVINNRGSTWVFQKLVELLIRPGDDELTGRLRSHSGPDWDKRYIVEIQEFDSFVTDMNLSDKPLSYRYLHFSFTHFPVDFDAQCRYRGDGRSWFAANQNREGLMGETTCAMHKMNSFLRRLKDLGIYDSALIVFKSDHGHPTNYFDDYPYNLEINEHERWGFSRYRPTLMIKPARSTQSQVERRLDLVLLNDLAKTICLHSGTATSDLDCDVFPGIDLLGHPTEDTGYFLYVVPTAESSFTFDGHIPVPIGSRLIDPVEALTGTEGVSLGERAD